MDRPLTSLSVPPSTLKALLRAGFETTNDLEGQDAEQLSKELSIPLSATQEVLTQRRSTHAAGPILTQPASKARASDERIPTYCGPIDKLLGGGLARGSVLEISGPPGTPKSGIAMGMVRRFVHCSDWEDEEVVFVDTQNMATPAALKKAIPNEAAQRRVLLHSLHTVTELICFVHAMSRMKKTRPKLGLVVLSDLHFPLQSTSSRKLSIPQKNAIFDGLKKAIATLSSSKVTIITTTQLGTKLLAADGSPANFDTGARAIMAPHMGTTYLPASNSYRIIMWPRAKDSGVFKILTAPSRKDAGKEEPYLIPPRRVLPVSPS
ncbi:Rad51 domain-containing protein [Mycena kentingensis (nom. inval.)]|nr:Rad51 domain-containing protein [Mycena kentingensis (nom. inval.)]